MNHRQYKTIDQMKVAEFINYAAVDIVESIHAYPTQQHINRVEYLLVRHFMHLCQNTHNGELNVMLQNYNRNN